MLEPVDLPPPVITNLLTPQVHGFMTAHGFIAAHDFMGAYRQQHAKQASSRVTSALLTLFVVRWSQRQQVDKLS